MSKNVPNSERQRPILTATVSKELYGWIKTEVEKRNVSLSAFVESLLECGRKGQQSPQEVESLVEEKRMLEQELARLKAERQLSNSRSDAAIVEKLCDVIKEQQQLLQRCPQAWYGLSDDAVRVRRLVPLLLEFLPPKTIPQRLANELARALVESDYSLPPELKVKLDALEERLLQVLQEQITPA